MWMFRIRRERKHYYDGAELVARVAKIESRLERLGGNGNGIYEKYEGLAAKFPKEMKDNIITLGMVRNGVVHGSPDIKEKEKVFALCDEIETIIINRMKHDGISTGEGLGGFGMLVSILMLIVVSYFLWEYVLKR